MAEPSAGPCSDTMTLSGQRSTSAYTCITNASLTRPPATTNSVTPTPAARKLSMMTRVPNAVASTSAR